MAISLGQLDLEALKNYLKIVHGFRTVDDLSGDTEKVAGVLAQLMAQAAVDENGNLLVDRNTVVNALNLVKINEDGSQQLISGDGVLTDEEGRQLKASAVKAANSTADDMRSLRNEMYHLKRDMIRNGSLAFDPVYNGFIDPFMQNNEMYTADMLAVESIDGANSINVVGDVEAYTVGQHAALMSDEDSLLLVEQVTDVTSTTVTLGNGTFIFNSSPATLSKTYGVYENGRFVFANNQSRVIDTGKSMSMIYKDGPERLKIAELNETMGITGFASTLVVPAALDNNFLQSINLSLRIIGSPGNIYVELYDYNVDMAYGDPIATSNYLNSGLATSDWRSYEFRFDKEIFLEKGHEYLVLVKAIGTSTNNVWSLGGFTEVCNNALHQDTYLYSINGAFLKEGPDLITNKIADLYMGLSTSLQEQTEFVYEKFGLYTGSFELENDIATRCRVSFNPRLDSNIDKYQVIVKGAKRENGILGDYVFANFVQRLQYNHTVWSNGKESGNEFCFDFNFPQEVNVIEFQILFASNEVVIEENHEALYAVVVCTDSAYIQE